MQKDADMIGIYGRRRSGKSTQIKERTQNHNRVVAYDPMEEYGAYGYKTCKSMKHVLQAIKAGWSKGFRVAYVPPTSKLGAMESLHKLSWLLLNVQKPYFNNVPIPKVLFVVDELKKAFPGSGLPDQFDGFVEMCERGGHYGIDLVGASQRVSKVNTVFRGNCSERYFYAQNEAIDVDAIVKMVGREHRQTIQRLQTHEYLRLQDGIVTPGKNSLYG